MNKRLQIFKYIIFDALAAALAWIAFFVFRKFYFETEKYGYQIPVEIDRNFILAMLFIPLYWIAMYALSGHYRNIYRRSRLREIGQVFQISLIGVLVLFFGLLLDDEVKSYKAYYQTVIVLFSLHFFITGFFRLLLTTLTKRKILSGKIYFNTVIIGNEERALNLFNELNNEKHKQGYRILGYLDAADKENDLLKDKLQYLGEYSQLPQLIKNKNIDDVIIAIKDTSHSHLEPIFNLLQNVDVKIKIIPDMYDIVTGSVKMSNIWGAALVEVNTDLIPEWQRFTKRVFDILLSVLVLIIGLPFLLLVAILVKITSKGPVFYTQERIGLGGKPFSIIKFRTMRTDAEQGTPMLSGKNDDRRTPLGIFLRKVRIDELPQFFNVLKGDMSIVGYRPERQFFINQILEKAPHYRHLYKIRPGITSWGMVKYGYAENVDEMIERLKYDILYIENMSLSMDIKILFYTVLIIIQGRGK